MYKLKKDYLKNFATSIVSLTTVVSILYRLYTNLYLKLGNIVLYPEYVLGCSVSWTTKISTFGRKRLISTVRR